MDGANNYSENVQQQNSVLSSGISLMDASSNRRQIVMIPTPRIISTDEEMEPKTSQSVVVTGTSSLHQTDNQGNQTPIISSPMTSHAPSIVMNTQTWTSRAHHSTMTSSPLVAQLISVSAQILPLSQTHQNFTQTLPLPQTHQSMTQTLPLPQMQQNMTQTSPLPQTHRNMPQTHQNLPQTHQNMTQSLPLSQTNQNLLQTLLLPQTHQNLTQSLPLPQTHQNLLQTLHLPQTHQNLPQTHQNMTQSLHLPQTHQNLPQTHQNLTQSLPLPQTHQNLPETLPLPQTYQNLTQSLPLPQTNQNLSSIGFNPCANQRIASSSYAPRIDPQVNSANWRPQANMSDILFTSNNNNGARLVPNAISTPTNAQMTTRDSSISPVHAVTPTASICLPIVRAPSQQGIVQTDAMRPYDVPSVYVQQLHKYQRFWSQRPKDNNITFWRQFVTEFFAPDGKRKCCLSACQDNSATKYRRSKETLPCDICKAYSQSGHEIPFEELPIFFQSKFKFCKDEVLKLNKFLERNLVNKTAVLYFPTAIEQSRDDKFLSIRKGHLAVTFNCNKKILSWQFCMRSCEKLAPEAPVLSRVNEMLTTVGNSSGASETNSDQQWTQQNRIELTNNLDQRNQFSGGVSMQDTSTNMINGHPNSMKNSMDFNSRNEHQTDHMLNYTAQQTLSHQIQSQPILSTAYPSLGANNNQVNFPVQQFLDLPSILDTSASGCNPATSTISSVINPDTITNPQHVVPTFNARLLSGSSDPTNPLKRAVTTEHELRTDAPEQRATQQRLEDTFSENGVETGNGGRNLAPALGLTEGLDADDNINSTANPMNGSGVNLTGRQIDQFSEGTDPEKELYDLLEYMLNH